MKKKYTKPGIVKVELNHEQAILGVCSSGASTSKGQTVYCTPACKAINAPAGADSAASS